jgi:SH3-like domain-containing protein
MPTFLGEKYFGEFSQGAQVYVKSRQEFATVIDEWEEWRAVLYDDETYEWVHETNLKGW